MNWYSSLLFLAITGEQFSSVFSLVCVLTEPPITRRFDDLEEYQANIIDFIPYKAGFKGNHVEFRFNTSDHLIKNIFKTYDSEHIIKLDLGHMTIKKIDKGTFLSLSCLHILDLSNNEISDLNEDALEGLGRLRELNLSRNYLTELSAYQFKELTDLTILDLSSNLITKVDEKAFFNLSLLNSLNLNSNLLITFPSSLQYLSNLKTLLLQSNRIRSPQFVNLNNVSETIEILDLSQNCVDNINYDTRLTFPAMKYLNLSDNSLTRLDVYAISTKFPNLKKIDVNYNFWDCHILSALEQGFRDMNITFAGIKSTACSKQRMADVKSPLLRNFSTDHDAFLGNFYNTASANNQEIKSVLHSVNLLRNVAYLYLVFIGICVVYFVMKVICAKKNSTETYSDWLMIKNRYHREHRDQENQPLLEIRKYENYQGTVI